MKKLLYLFLCGTIVTTGSITLNSCGSDDSTTQVPNPQPEPEPEPEPENKTLIVTASENQVYVGETVTLTATLDGQDVTSGTTFYLDEVVITGNTVTSSTPANMLIKGKYPNANDSQYVDVAFVENPFEGIVGTGNFIYNGTANSLTGAFLSLQGFYSDGNGGATAWWIQYGWNGQDPNAAEDMVAISFDTPATLVGEEITDFVMPDANQNTYYSIIAARVNGQNMISAEYTEGTGVIVYNSLDQATDPVTTNFDMQISGVHNISFTYDGAVLAKNGRKTNQMKGGNAVKSQKQYEIDKKNLSRKLLRK